MKEITAELRQEILEACKSDPNLYKYEWGCTPLQYLMEMERRYAILRPANRLDGCELLEIFVYYKQGEQDWDRRVEDVYVNGDLKTHSEAVSELLKTQQRPELQNNGAKVV